MIEDELELGDVLDKYVDMIGASNAIALYNKFALKCQEKNNIYEDHHTYARVADRYMSRMVYRFRITKQDDLLAQDINDLYRNIGWMK